MIDNRVVASAQLQRQSLSDQSPQTMQLRKHLASLNKVTQRAEDDELAQGKFETAQRVEEEEPAQRAKLDEEPIQGKFDIAQRIEEEEPAQRAKLDEEPIQGKFDTAQRVEEEEPAQKKANEGVNNTGLPNQLKAGIESLSGMSMDHVKVHYNSAQPAQLNAHAYAQGSDIHVAPGQEQHLPHEAWHVVQQAQGRVKPTMQMKMGVPVNDDVGLETEADVMGAKAMQLKSYDGSVKVKSVITAPDLNDWSVVRSKLDGVAKGGDAYEIGPRVDASLAKLGLATGESAMSAHMIPNRIGGSGKAANVRPWKDSFERGTWETSVESVFNQELLSAKVDDVVDYKVNTTELSDGKVDEIIGTSTVATEKTKPEHKARLLEIPADVSATVGSKSLGTTDEPFKGLIKGY
jgi:hypothetical protein